MMEIGEIIQKIQPKKSPYNRTMYLIHNYKDLKNGERVNEAQRDVLKVIENAVDMIRDDRYIKIIQMMMEGKTAEKIAVIENMDIKNVYRQRKRLIKRLSIIIYGDEAL